jgi:hypothetical protein
MAEDQIVDVFSLVPKLKEQHEETVTRATKADEMLTNLIPEIDQVQEQREQNLAQTVKAKEQINTEVQEQTNNLTQTVVPIFQKRAAIAQRRTEIATMNPFERIFKGITSREYNPAALDRMDDALAGELQTLGQMYQHNLQTQEILMKGIDAHHENQDSILRLGVDNKIQDLQFASQAVGSAQTVFNTSLQGIAAQTEVIRAKAAARNEILSGMTLADANKALSMAKQNGGIAVINGVELREGELREIQMNWQEKNMALEARSVALQAGKLQLAQQLEQRAISKMTSAEIDQAIKNGGVFNGQRLDQVALTQALAASRQRQALIADQAVTQSGLPTAARALESIGQNQRFITERSMTMFGQTPREVTQHSLALTAKLNAYTAGLKEATAAGAGAAYVEREFPKIQEMMKGQQQLMEGLATRFAGGQKELIPLARGWLAGEPVSGPAAVQGLISLARTGLPAGVKLSGPVAQQFKMAQEIVRRHDAGTAGTAISQLTGGAAQGNGGQILNQLLTGAGKSGGKKQSDEALVGELSRMLQSSYNSSNMSNVISNAPAIAGNIKDSKGQPLPLSRVPLAEFQAALARGDEKGYEIVGRELGLNSQQARQLFAQGESGTLAKQLKSKKSDFNFREQAAALQANQTQQFLLALDQTSAATPTFKPSKAYVETITSPQFQSRVMNGIAAQGQSNFGDFMLSNIAPNGFDNTLYQYSQMTQSAYHKNLQVAQDAAIKLAPENFYDPVKKADFTLGVIDGINAVERRALMRVITQEFQARGNSVSGQGHEGREAFIDNVILNSQFNDPALEAVRKRAASQWAPAKKIANSSLRALMSSGDDD